MLTDGAMEDMSSGYLDPTSLASIDTFSDRYLGLDARIPAVAEGVSLMLRKAGQAQIL
jgi:hypothetical protein